MARLALPAGWAGALVRQRGPLRTYQWLWLLLCLVGALAVTAPRVLSQPLVYTSTATVQLDVARRYNQLYANGRQDLQAVEHMVVEQLKFDYPGLGAPTLGVRFDPQ